MRNMKNLLALGLSAFLLSCGSLYKKSVCGDDKDALSWYENGYDPIHINSCGPHSLSGLFSYFDECADRQELSKEILENRNALRNFGIGIARTFDARAMAITFPDEMQETLKRHGYNFKIINGERSEMFDYILKMCYLEEKGITRLKDPNSVIQHWNAFPNDNIFYPFGENSVFLEIYEVWR